MWGSDWPVCRLEASYDAWHDAARVLTAHLPTEAQQSLFGGTAQTFYRL
jgi:L-fuconolactonase